jgi:hypothetical protein
LLKPRPFSLFIYVTANATAGVNGFGQYSADTTNGQFVTGTIQSTRASWLLDEIQYRK